MINSEDFSHRLQNVIEFYDETASSFAEKIGVQRSSISHILSGRNKPSLDFVMKVLHTFPDVELYWLLNGKGSFPANTNESTAINNREDAIDRDQKSFDMNTKSNIERIVIFYKDGSFKSYKP